MGPVLLLVATIGAGSYNKFSANYKALQGQRFACPFCFSATA
jgi:hypothetical protein